MSEPRPRVFENHRCSVVHEKFVDDAIAGLVHCDFAREVSMAEVCVVSPLGVVEGRKLRLILDLRYVNNHLATFQFKCDGLDCLVDMYEKGDRIVQFDLKSAHHHIDSWPPCAKYLGLVERAGVCVLLAAVWLVNGPHTVLQSDACVLVKFWRRQSFRSFLFYDDGSLAHQERREAFAQGQIVKADVLRCGFLLSDAKCAWDPEQCAEVLGYSVDTLEGFFSESTTGA